VIVFLQTPRPSGLPAAETYGLSGKMDQSSRKGLNLINVRAGAFAGVNRPRYWISWPSPQQLSPLDTQALLGKVDLVWRESP